MSEALLISQHLKFLRGHLVTLPASYRSFDSNRVAILYFTLSTLDVLGKLEEEVDAELRTKIIEWIYRLQLKSDSGEVFSGKDICEMQANCVLFVLLEKFMCLFSDFWIFLKLLLYVLAHCF
ncbi:unnamed protein product [Cercopithifilaria johnstoni]|uniref:Prenyltransferase alpha-alpha toroid domain-containing protein n=1 Tax=Cercopithifilaria johnstoni TaxID=2874296 RepID=A0A8J2M6Y7_9BILA|nr:unnamed protein product [Cercopithifilaria johnstoni]